MCKTILSIIMGTAMMAFAVPSHALPTNVAQKIGPFPGPVFDVMINFDNLPVNTIVTNQYPEVIFSSVAGFMPTIIPYTDAGDIDNPWDSNILRVFDAAGNIAATRDLILDFTAPVKDLSLLVTREHYTVGVIGQMDLFINGVFSTTKNIDDLFMGGCHVSQVPPYSAWCEPTGSTSSIDLGGYNNVTRLRLYNMNGSVGYDNISFNLVTTVSEPSSLILIGLGYACLVGRYCKWRRETMGGQTLRHPYKIYR